jgi:uncharacterized linocin/CFP29 family protein
VNLLKRELAPIVDEAWALIDDEARAVLSSHLAGRKLIDVVGPKGWDLAGINTGELFQIDSDSEVSWSLRSVQPLSELCVPFELTVADLDLAGRGAASIDLDPVSRAARAIASDEDRALFHGVAAARIDGIIDASTHNPIAIGGADDYPRAVIDAASLLRRAGVGGPYAVVLGATSYDELFTAADDGYPIAKRVERVIDGPIVRAPSLDGGAMVSLRGGDFQMTLGRDFSIGFSHRDRDRAHLFITESFTFQVFDPAAAVELRRSK